MFTPLGTFDGPLLCDLCIQRTTIVTYQEPTEFLVINDVWTSNNGKALLDRTWTGRTMFQVKTHLPTQIDSMTRNPESRTADYISTSSPVSGKPKRKARVTRADGKESRKKPKSDPSFDPIKVALSLSPDEEELERELQNRISVALAPLKIEQITDPYAGLLVSSIDA